MPPDPALVRTDRLRLRRPTAGDVDEVYRVHGDPATQRYNRSGPDADLSASRERLAEWLRHWAAHGFGIWVVHERTPGSDPNGVLGFGGVRVDDGWPGGRVLNLYYRLAPPAWGRGIGTEVANAAIHLAAELHPQLPVQCWTTSDNLASRRTALAAGLVRRPDLDVDPPPELAGDPPYTHVFYRSR